MHHKYSIKQNFTQVAVLAIFGKQGPRLHIKNTQNVIRDINKNVV